MTGKTIARHEWHEIGETFLLQRNGFVLYADIIPTHLVKNETVGVRADKFVLQLKVVEGDGFDRSGSDWYRGSIGYWFEVSGALVDNNNDYVIKITKQKYYLVVSGPAKGKRIKKEHGHVL